MIFINCLLNLEVRGENKVRYKLRHTKKLENIVDTTKKLYNTQPKSNKKNPWTKIKKGQQVCAVGMICLGSMHGVEGANIIAERLDMNYLTYPIIAIVMYSAITLSIVSYKGIGEYYETRYGK